MIYKDSLLDAYMTLNGSNVQHAAYLVTLVLVLGTPEDIVDEELRSMCTWLFNISIATHVLCFIFKIFVIWNRMLSFKPFQVLETVLVILHVYLMLVSVELFAKLQYVDIQSGNKLNPNLNHITTGKNAITSFVLTFFIVAFLGSSDLSADEMSVIALQRYYYWALLQISLFFSYILSIILYMTCHALSPFTSYQFYLTKAITNPTIDWSTVWKDFKPVE